MKAFCMIYILALILNLHVILTLDPTIKKDLKTEIKDGKKNFLSKVKKTRENEMKTLTKQLFENEEKNDKVLVGNNSENGLINRKITFLQEFFLSFSLNFFSEIGDKSFVSIILVYNQITPFALFIIASLAEILMNLFSVLIGYELRTHPTIKVWCHFAGMAAAIIFSLMLLYEVVFQEEEKESTDEEAKIQEEKKETKSNIGTFLKIANIAWIIFMSELGDKSQITTIILSAEYNPYAIFFGTALAHVVGIILSMTIGYFLAKNINKAILSTIGAFCFIYFGVQVGMNFFSDGGFKALIGLA